MAVPVAGPHGEQIMVERDGGAVAAWVCVTDRAATDGTFADFTAKLLGAHVVANLTLNHVSATIEFADGSGLAFGWGTELLVTPPRATNASTWPMPLHGFGRLDNVYGKTSFPAPGITLSYVPARVGFDPLPGRRVPCTPRAHTSRAGCLCRHRYGGLAAQLDWSMGSRQLIQPGSPAPTVDAVGLAAATKCLDVWDDEQFNFNNWDYEGGVVQTGLWELLGVLPDSNFTNGAPAALSARLDYFAMTPGQLGYVLTLTAVHMVVRAVRPASLRKREV